jgi:hypothetical protein
MKGWIDVLDDMIRVVNDKLKHEKYHNKITWQLEAVK